MRANASLLRIGVAVLGSCVTCLYLEEDRWRRAGGGPWLWIWTTIGAEYATPCKTAPRRPLPGDLWAPGGLTLTQVGQVRRSEGLRCEVRMIITFKATEEHPHTNSMTHWLFLRVPGISTRMGVSEGCRVQLGFKRNAQD